VDLELLWKRYKETDDQKAREKLLEHYYPIVDRVAYQVGSGLPANVDRGDLKSYGTFGLIDALNKFRPEKGIKFETYASSRIRGAILDELRSIDWVPRSLRSKVRAIEATSVKLETTLHRRPTDAEIAEDLGWEPEQVSKALGTVSNTSFLALDESSSDDPDAPAFGATIASADHGLASLEFESLAQGISSSIAQLTEKERIVMTLYYYEGLSLNEIGKVMGVTESRVCQIHTKAVLSGKTFLTN